MRSPSPGCVVLSYGPNRAHEALVEELRKAGVALSDIVIVHNPAQPDEPPMPDSPSGAMVLRMSRNLGYTGGMNAGIKHFLARHFEWILLLNDDVRFRPDALPHLLEAAGRADGYGLLGPALRWSNGRLYYGGRRDRMGFVTSLIDDPTEADLGAVVEIDWVQGCALLARGAVFEQIGLLDESFFMYTEETELCLRASRAGWRIGVVPGAVAEQEHGHVKRPLLFSYLVARNKPEYMRRASGSRGVALLLWREISPSWELLKVWKGRRSAPHQRRRARAILLAKAQGTAAFFAGRWGMPPAWLWNEEPEKPQQRVQGGSQTTSVR